MSDDLIKLLLANDLDECDEAATLIEALQAENARQRKALTYYAEMCDWQSPPPHCNEDVCCKIARAALSATKPAAEPLDMTRPGDVAHDT